MSDFDRLPAQRLAVHLGADVRTADGRHAGTLQRILVDGESWDPKGLVVRETDRFSGRTFAPGAGSMVAEIIVPLAAVDAVTPGEVRLNLDARTTRRLPPYLSYQYGPPRNGDGLRFAAALAAGPLGIGPIHRLPEEIAAKPEGDIEIRHGENVMIGHGGEKLGTVQDILFDDGELVGIVVRPTGFFTHDVLVQVRFLDRSDDLALFLRMTPDDVRPLSEVTSHT